MYWSVRSLLFRCVPAVVLGAASSAQLPQLFQIGEVRAVGIAPALVDTDFRSAVAGHLMGFYVHDAVVLAGTTPVLLATPGVHSSAVRLPLPAVPVEGFGLDDVRDIGMLRDSVSLQGSTGLVKRDGLVMVTGGGLWRWHWSNVTGAAITRLSSDPAWNGALKLRTGDVDGDGQDDVLALLPDSRTIRVHYSTGSEWAVDAGASVRDWQVMDWEVGGNAEIVAVTAATGSFPGGIQVFAAGNPDFLSRVNLANSSAVCATARDAAGACRLMVACRTNSVDKLFVAGPSGLTQVRRFAAEAKAIGTGNMDGDAGDEVYLTFANEGNPWRLVQTGSFAFGDPQVVALGSGNVAGNRSVPLLADFNGDGVREIAYGHKGTGKVCLQRCMTWGPTFVDVESNAQSAAIAALPSGMQPTHVEVFLWPMSLTASPLIDTSAAAQVYLTPLEASGPTITATLVVPDLDLDHPWSAAVRFVQIDAAGNVLRGWPIRSTIFCNLDDQAEVLALFPGEQILGQQQTSSVLLAVTGGAIPPIVAGGIHPGTGGAVVQPPDLPEPGSGTPPKPPGDG